MKRKPWKQGRFKGWGALLLGPALVLLLALLLIPALGDMQRAGAAEAERLLSESLHRAALTCYAIEGRYPPSLEYLTAHYGLNIDSERYAVHYSVFADNMMPDITVIALTSP